jgi:ATP-dependent Lon protease
LYSQEIEILEIEKKINFRVKKQIEKNQKEFYLREQMKAIQRELGQQDERIAEADEYREKVQALECCRKSWKKKC